MTSSQSHYRRIDIIVVDDSRLDTELLLDILSEKKFIVRPYLDGPSAFADAKKEAPDLFLVDVNLPGMDGFELCKKLQKDLHTQGIPIIFISASDDTTDKVNAFSAGGVDYITKPYQAEEVLARIKTHYDLYMLKNQLEKQNQLLSLEIFERKNVEAKLEKHREQLEKLVKARTSELEKTNKLLEQEITDRNKIEDDLRKSKERLDLAMFGANDGIWDWWLDENIVFFDDRYYTMAGYDPNEFPASYSEWKNRLHPDDVNRTKQAIAQYLEGASEIYDTEFRFQRKDLTYMWIRGKGKIVARDDSGAPIRFIGTHSEITDQKRTEEKLRDREQLLANVFETMQEGVLVLDKKFRYTYWNKSMEETSHANREEVLGRVAWEKFPFLKGEIQHAMVNAMQGNITLNQELHYKLPDGKKGWTQESYLPLKDMDGEIIGVVGVIEEVSNRKHSQMALLRSEAKFRGLVESSADFIWEVNQEGTYTYASPQIETILGYEPAEVVGKKPFDLMPPEEATRLSELFKIMVEKGTPFTSLENINLHKDGRGVILETSGVPFFDSSGSLLGYRGVDRDITKRKQAEEELRVSEANYRTIFDTGYDAIFVHDIETGAILDANKQMCEMYGYTHDEVMNLSVEDISLGESPYTQKEAIEWIHRAATQGPQTFEWLCKKKNGETFWVEVTLKRVIISGHERVLATECDITERKQAADKLRASEANYRTIFNTVYDAIFVHDMETGAILDVNKRMCEMFGYTYDEALLLNIEDISLGDHPYTQKEADEWIHKAASQGPQAFEWLCKKKNGETFWVEVTLKRAMIGGHERVLATNRDITERKQTESELQHLRNYLSNIINSMPSMLIGVDLNGKVTQWNKTAERVTGLTAFTAQGKTLSDIVPQMTSEIQKITESIRTGQIKHEQKRPRPSEHGTCFEDVTIYPLITNGVEGAVIRIDDVTDKVRMEEIMIQSEKMLSVGGLAAGLAHEINNPLASMVQTAEVMANRLTGGIGVTASLKAAENAGITIKAIHHFMEDRGILRMIRTIRESGHRVSNIVENMLSFARKSNTHKSSHDIEALLDKTLALAAADYDLKKRYDFKMIEIIKEYESNLPTVSCEGAKIQQVLLNILRNGAQAMQEGETQHPQLMLRTAFEKTQNMVRIEIEDNGPGMEEATRKRVFEPFFTTKAAGVGTGLGLSVSYFIITENHHGEMDVESHFGDGAKFIIRLPV